MCAIPAPVEADRTCPRRDGATVQAELKVMFRRLAATAAAIGTEPKLYCEIEVKGRSLSDGVVLLHKEMFMQNQTQGMVVVLGFRAMRSAR